MATGQTSAATMPKCIQAKEPELEEPLTGVIPKWEANTHRWEAEVIAPTRPADSNNKARRKSRANTDVARSRLQATLQMVTVTRRKVAGMEVPA